MLDRMPHPKAPLLVPDAGERDSVRWDGWRVVFPTDAEYAEEYAAARHEQRAYGQPLRYGN